MTRRRLLIEVDDDGQVLDVKVWRYEGVGTAAIGPIPVADIQRLSFPSPVVEDWQRDVAVQVVELL